MEMVSQTSFSRAVSDRSLPGSSMGLAMRSILQLEAVSNRVRKFFTPGAWATGGFARSFPNPSTHTDLKKWLGPESNRRHEDFQSSALPTELPSRVREGSEECTPTFPWQAVSGARREHF